MARRSYGTGSLHVRADANGRETYYGSWYVGRRRVKRKIGPKRLDGTRDGLTRAQAERRLRELMGEVVPSVAADSRRSVAEVGALLVADLQRKGRKPETIRAVDVAVRVHAAPFFGERAMDTITREDIERLALHMAREGARTRRGAPPKGLAPKSVRNYIGSLSSLWNFGIKKGYVMANVVSPVFEELPKPDDVQEIRYLTPDELMVLVDAIPEGPYAQTDRTLFLTAAMTGLRLGELRALRWRNVDWTASRVRVVGNYVRGRFQTPKTRRGRRSVPLADTVAGALDRHYRAIGEPADHKLVFPDPITGEPLDDGAIRDRLREALVAARLDPNHTFHDLRHTFGTAMAAAGMPMRTLQELMGHRDLATTQIYAHYAPSAQEAAFVDGAFGRGTNLGTNSSESTVS